MWPPQYGLFCVDAAALPPQCGGRGIAAAMWPPPGGCRRVAATVWRRGVAGALCPPRCSRRRRVDAATWPPPRGCRGVAVAEWPSRSGRGGKAAATWRPRRRRHGTDAAVPRSVSAAGCWLLTCVDWLLAAGPSLLVAVWLLLAACFRFAGCFVLQLDASCLLAAASAATQVRPQGLFAQSCECSVTECFGR